MELEHGAGSSLPAAPAPQKTCGSEQKSGVLQLSRERLDPRRAARGEGGTCDLAELRQQRSCRSKAALSTSSPAGRRARSWEEGRDTCGTGPAGNSGRSRNQSILGTRRAGRAVRGCWRAGVTPSIGQAN